MDKLLMLLKKRITLIILLIASVFVYLYASNHVFRIVNMAMLYAVVAMGISIMLGMTGMMSFASIVFFGIGAYVTAEFTTGFYGFTTNSIVAIISAVIINLIVSGVLGSIILKLKGTFFSFATIALVQIGYNLFTNYVPLFGGASGITGIPTFQVLSFKASNSKTWFIVCLILVLLAYIFVERIRSTQLGRSLASIRDDNIVAVSLGINVKRTKLYAFMIAAALAGVAGSFYAMMNAYIGSEMFTYAKSTEFIVMAMIGGINDSAGVVLGALLITVIPELFRSFADWFRLFYGIAVVLLMIFLPTGVTGMIQGIFSFIGNTFKKIFRKGE